LGGLRLQPLQNAGSDGVDVTDQSPASKQLRVLVVEDEILIAMLLSDMLAELGYDVVGPVSDIERAVLAVDAGGFELAILDVNLNGRRSSDVADKLKTQKIPFIFATGYSFKAPEGFENVPTLQKPFQLHDLRRALDVIREGVVARPA
jgi:CheY-like chemotaxis protein